MGTHPHKIFDLQRHCQLLPLSSFLPMNPGSLVSFEHFRLQPQSSFSSHVNPFCLLHFCHCYLSSPGHPCLNPAYFLHLRVLSLQPKQEQFEVSILLCSPVPHLLNTLVYEGIKWGQEKVEGEMVPTISHFNKHLQNLHPSDFDIMSEMIFLEEVSSRLLFPARRRARGQD